MATTIIRPTGDNSLLNAQNSDDNTTDLYSYVDEEVASDIDYVKEVLSEDEIGYAVFNFGDISLPSGATIDKIVLNARVKIPATHIYFSDPGSNIYGFKINTHSINYSYAPTGYTNDSYSDITKELTNNPYTGSAWTETEINDLIYGFSCFCSSSKGGTLYFSQLYITVYYTAGGGSTVSPFPSFFRQ